MTKNISLRTKGRSGSIRKGRTRTAFAACAMFLMFLGGAAQSAELKWPSGLYRYLVINQDVREMLIEFGRNLNINVKVSENLGGGRIRGGLPITTAQEFLNRLCEIYGLVWYYDGALLHINSVGEVRTEVVELGELAPNGVSEKLQALGIADARYAIRSTGDSRVLSVSGPPPYVALVRQTVAVMRKAAAPRNVREVQEGDDVNVRVFRGNRTGS